MLLPAGALVVHQLRYSLSYGSQASDQLAAQGHAYLGSLVPWIVMLVAAGLGSFVARLARASRPDGNRVRPFIRVWATTGSGLVAIYAVQELLEGLLAQGHPTGVAGIFGHGGWWSIPAAAAVSFGIALLLRVAHGLVRLAGGAASSTGGRRSLTRRRPAVVLLTLSRPLASAAAGRAPPRVLPAG